MFCNRLQGQLHPRFPAQIDLPFVHSDGLTREMPQQGIKFLDCNMLKVCLCFLRAPWLCALLYLERLLGVHFSYHSLARLSQNVWIA